MTAKSLLLLPIIVLAACAQRYDWTREGAPQGEIEVARETCSKEAMSYGFLDGPDQSIRVVTRTGERYSNLYANTAAREYSLFNQCMWAMGYSLEPLDNGDAGNN